MAKLLCFTSLESRMPSTIGKLTFDHYLDLIQNLISKMGFRSIRVVEKSKRDEKALIKAEKRDEFGTRLSYLIYVEKTPSSRLLGIEDVQRAKMLMEAHEADRLIYVSTSRFAPNVEGSTDPKVKLIDLGELNRLLREYGIEYRAAKVDEKLDVSSILRRLRSYSPPDFDVYSRTTEEVLYKVYSKLREAGLQPGDAVVKEIILEVEPLYKVDWVAEGRDYYGNEVDETGTVYIGPDGEIYTPSLISRLFKRGEEGRTPALLRLKKSRRRIAPRDFPKLLRGVKLMEVGRLERDRVKAMSLVKDFISGRLDISRDKVRIMNVEKFLVGTKWIIYLETRSGLGNLRYYEINDLVSEPELPVMSRDELEDEIVSWFASRYGEVCDVEKVEFDGLWADFWVSSPQHVGRIRIHRTTGRVADYSIYLGREAITRLAEERLGGRVVSLSRLEETYEILLERDEEYLYALASAEDGSIMETSRVSVSALEEMALESISKELSEFEWMASSVRVESPRHLIVDLSSRGGSAEYRYDLRYGSGKLSRVEVNEDGAAEMIRSAFPSMDLTSLERSREGYVARLEDRCWTKEVVLSFNGAKMEVVDSRMKRECAMEVARLEWERKYGVVPEIVSAEFRGGMWSIEGLVEGWEYRAVLTKEGVPREISRRMSRELAVQKARSLVEGAREVEVRASTSSPAWIVKLKVEDGGTVYLKMDWESGSVVDRERFSGLKGKLKEKIVVSRRFS